MQHRGKRFGLTILVLLLGLATSFSQSNVPDSPLRTSATPGAANPYDSQLAALEAGWDVQSPVERAVTVERVYGLREYVTSPQSIAAWLSRIAQDNSESSVAKVEAQHYAALMQVHAGNRVEVPPLAPEAVTAAQDAVAEAPNSAERLEALGLLERERGLATASEHLLAAARLAPTAKRWVEAARACADPGCTLATLTSALHADAANVEANLMLAAYYRDRGQAEKARDLLRGVIERAPGDFVARKQLADIYAAAGAKSAALAEYRRLENEFPAPQWLRRELAAQYERLGFLDQALSLAKAELAQNVDDRQAREIAIRILQKRGDSAGLRACYEDMLRLEPDDAQAMMRLADLEAGNGRFQQAESLLRRALAANPNDEELRRDFADTLAAQGKGVQAHAQLAHILEIDPGQDNVRRELAWERDGRYTEDADAAYLVQASALAHEAQAAAAGDHANVTAIADVRIERVQANGLSSVRAQQLFRINTAQGAREYATRTVQYASGTQRLRILEARLYKPDGRVIDAEDCGDDSAESAAAIYYDARSRRLRFPGLEKGDVIELDYRLSPQSSTNPYGPYFGDLVIFRTSVPERLQRYVLITPAAQKFNVVTARLPDPQVSEEDGHRIYRWELRDTPALPTEPKGPALTEVAPYVHVSSFSTWEEVGNWYAHLIAPQFSLDDDLRQAMAALLQGKTTDQEKIQAIHQFVLRNTHYVALEFGIYSYKPYPVSQVYARRFGDCKDKASLMIALLRATGIDADIALVRTRRLGDIGEQATSISIFNHAVVFVPKYNLWLDGTAEYAGSRELPLDDQGAMALTVAANGEAQLRRIPVTLPMENYTHREVAAQIGPDGKIEFTGSVYTRGEDAPGLRREYEIAERQRDSVRNRLAEVLPSVRVDTVQVYGTNDLERDVTVKFSGETDGNQGRRWLSLQTSWMPRSYIQTLAALPSRSQDLLLPAPWTTEEELHFSLPAGARVESVPRDQTLATPFGNAVLRYQQQNGELVVTTSVQFRKLRITPSEYPAFRNFCSQVENAFRAEIKVGLAG